MHERTVWVLQLCSSFRFHFSFTSLFSFPINLPQNSSHVWTVSVWRMSFTGYITGKRWKLNRTPCVCEMMRTNLHYPASPMKSPSAGFQMRRFAERVLVSDLLISIIIFTKKNLQSNILLLICQCWPGVLHIPVFIFPSAPPALFKAGGL